MAAVNLPDRHELLALHLVGGDRHSLPLQRCIRIQHPGRVLLDVIPREVQVPQVQHSLLLLEQWRHVSVEEATHLTVGGCNGTEVGTCDVAEHAGK